jgi:hypothetical protein
MLVVMRNNGLRPPFTYVEWHPALSVIDYLLSGRVKFMP